MTISMNSTHITHLQPTATHFILFTFLHCQIHRINDWLSFKFDSLLSSGINLRRVFITKENKKYEGLCIALLLKSLHTLVQTKKQEVLPQFIHLLDYRSSCNDMPIIKHESKKGDSCFHGHNFSEIHRKGKKLVCSRNFSLDAAG